MTRDASSALPGSIEAFAFAPRGVGANEAVDDREVEFGILRPELVDHRAGFVDQVEVLPHAAETDRPPLRHEHFDRRREHAAQRDVGDPRGLDQPLAEGVEVDPEDAAAAKILDERLHFPARQPDVAVNADAVDAQQRRREREGDALVHAEQEQQHAEHPAQDAPREAWTEASALRPFADARRKFRSDGALTVTSSPRRCSRAPPGCDRPHRRSCRPRA